VINLATNKTIEAIKINGIIWSSLIIIFSYILLRILRTDKTLSFLISIAILLNPFMFYYSGGVMPLPGGMGVALLILGIAAFLLRKEHVAYAMFTGLLWAGAILAKYTLLFFLLPFFIFISWNWLKKILNRRENGQGKVQKKEKILIPIISIGLFMLWMLTKDMLSSGKGPYAVSKLFFLQKSFLELLPYTTITYFLGFVLCIIFVLPFMLSLTKLNERQNISEKNLMILSWLTIYGLIIYLTSLVMLNGYARADIISFIISRTRFFIFIIPMAYILTLRHQTKRFRKIIMAIIFVSLILTIMLTSAATQNLINTKYNFFSTAIQRGAHREEAIEWVNDNIEKNSRIIIQLNEPNRGMHGLEWYIDDYFREDLKIIDQWPGIVDEEIYMITEKENLENQILYKTKYKPYVYVIKG